MMIEYALLVDTDKCFGCQTCEIACKDENNVGMGSRWMRVVEIGPKESGKNLKVNYLPLRCLHCGEPMCKDACPTEAISKRLDGIVILDPDLCTGCKACIQACPFGAPQYNHKKKIVEKCTMCTQRIDKGLEPACVSSCPTRAIHFGDINQIVELKRKNVGNSILL